MDNNSVAIACKPLIREWEVAERLEISIATIRRWRLVNKGPRWLKLGSAVRYKLEDVEEYIKQCSDNFDADIANREERAKKERERAMQANRRMYWHGQEKTI